MSQFWEIQNSYLKNGFTLILKMRRSDLFSVGDFFIPSLELNIECVGVPLSVQVKNLN